MNSIASTGQAHVPGEPGVWVMIGGDLLIFSLLFGTYLHHQGHAPDLFARAQQTLSQNIGIANTLLLLTSSWFVVGAVAAAHGRSAHKAGRFLLAALACGVIFLANKGIEWTAMVGAGHTLQANEFYMFFFMLTGIHAVHVAIGSGALVYAWLRLRGASEAGPRDIAAIESAAAFWHLIDLLWVVLFSLLYLVR